MGAQSGKQPQFVEGGRAEVVDQPSDVGDGCTEFALELDGHLTGSGWIEGYGRA